MHHDWVMIFMIIFAEEVTVSIITLKKTAFVAYRTYSYSELDLYNHMYNICRGGNGGGPCPTDDSWYYNKEDSTWTELPRCATPRVWPAMAPLTLSPGKAVLYGGSTAWSEQVISVSPVTVNIRREDDLY